MFGTYFYEVHTVGDGEKTLRHPEVGTMTLSHEGLTLNRAEGQRLVVYMAPPGSPDHDAMTLLDLMAPASSGSPREAARTQSGSHLGGGAG